MAGLACECDSIICVLCVEKLQLVWIGTQLKQRSHFLTSTPILHSTTTPFSVYVLPFQDRKHLLKTRQSKKASCLPAFLSSKRDGVPFNPTVKTCTRRCHPLWYAVLAVHCYLSIELSFLSSQLDLILPKLSLSRLGHEPSSAHFTQHYLPGCFSPFYMSSY